MPRREDDDVASRSGAVRPRTLLLAGGFALALAATLAVFLTDNPQYLRVAVVAVAWAFVLATFAAGRRGSDRAAAALRVSELRRAYELELEREVAARREYELELESELRRESEDAMRDELDALRGDLAALADLRNEVARISALRGDLAALTALHDDVARVAALREDVAALTSLRQELGQLTELRADMGRLRAELNEQLSSEMLVERIVMRTQASRLTGEPARLDGSSRAVDGWTDDVPPRELTGGWPAVRLDEPRPTQQFEQVRVDRPAPPRPEPAISWSTYQAGTYDSPPAGARQWDASPPTTSQPAALPPWASTVAPPTTSQPAGPPPWAPEPEAPAAAGLDRWSSPQPVESRHSRHAADEPVSPPPTATFSMTTPPHATPEPRLLSARPPVPAEPFRSPPVPAEPFRSPPDRLAERSLPDAPAPRSLLPEVPQRRRTDDGATDVPDPAAARTAERPAAPPRVRVEDRGGYRVALPAEPASPARDNRLAEILAENGVSPSSGGRRRRRYRDDDESDDVLARVLGRG
jgi:hypothetical protein